MEQMILNTAKGAFGLVGRLSSAPDRSSLVAVTGSFTNKGHLHEFCDWFPDSNVLIVTLPGMVTSWVATDPAGWSRAFDGILRRLLPTQPLVVFGSSTGALLSLGLEHPTIRRHVLFDPFFQTAPLWPFVDYARWRMAKYPTDQLLRSYLWNIFGMGEEALENRDYRYLLERLARPADVILAADPLEPEREMEGWPSLASAADRAALAAHPNVTLHHGPTGSGHGLIATPEGLQLVRRVLQRALSEAKP